MPDGAGLPPGTRSMTHLPECPDLFTDRVCICDSLRAVERRIRTHDGCADAEYAEGYLAGYEDALEMAQSAVARLVPKPGAHGEQLPARPR